MAIRQGARIRPASQATSFLIKRAIRRAKRVNAVILEAIISPATKSGARSFRDFRHVTALPRRVITPILFVEDFSWLLLLLGLRAILGTEFRRREAFARLMIPFNISSREGKIACSES